METFSLFEKEELSEINIGLIRLVKKLPDSLLFYTINSYEAIHISRIDDIILSGDYFDYTFSLYSGFFEELNMSFYLISNQSISSIQKNTPNELFVEEENVKFLLNNAIDVEYILFSPSICLDFSVISFPENWVFKIQNYLLKPNEDAYKIIQYYE